MKGKIFLIAIAYLGGGTMQCHQNHHVKAPFRLGNEKSGVN